MSKRGYISRYLLILKVLKGKPFSTFIELEQYIQERADQLQQREETLEMGFSKSTLGRDIKDIRKIFGINIVYNKRKKGYFIDGGDGGSLNFERMMEEFDLFHSLNLVRDAAPYVQLEKRRPHATAQLHSLLNALKDHQEINFVYHKFWEEQPTNRSAAPYALKEFKKRWYLLAKDKNDGRLKSFALDRLTELDVTNVTFATPVGFNAADYYRNCFGIMSPNAEAPEQVVLSFDAFQGKYIKTLPLHETQTIVIDNEDELQVSLQLYVTHDLIMELMAHGNSVKVLQPQWLVAEVRIAHESAYRQYQE